ncbi:MAG: isochorismatase family protein [Rhodospirillales bacterium]
MSDATHALLAQITETLPVTPEAIALAGSRVGLIIVDVINGFARVGGGALAPQAPDARVASTVAETNRLARWFAERQLPIAVFLDTHEPGRPEHPYPPHCEEGSGEEELVDELKWLETSPQATLIRKDCINAFVGAHDHETGENRIVSWLNDQAVGTVVVVGLCTDICVMDFVLTMLSARNHGHTATLHDVIVYEPGCATYDLPRATAEAVGLPPSAAHPQALTHHLGLYFMASRGARIASAIL